MSATVMVDGVVHPVTQHHHAVSIAPGDIDFMGHVNNAVYLTWVQDAVIAYWRKVAPAEAVAAHLWVALKHEITYRRPAFLEDQVIATVVAERVQGARALFRTLIKRGEDVLAEVESSWCALDAQSRRPIRVAREIAARFLADLAPGDLRE
jgi:acyl-CoA thioester hydrolase